MDVLQPHHYLPCQVGPLDCPCYTTPYTITLCPPLPRFLQVIIPKETEPEAELTEHVRQSLAAALNIQGTDIVEDDVQKWLAGMNVLWDALEIERRLFV